MKSVVKSERHNHTWRDMRSVLPLSPDVSEFLVSCSCCLPRQNCKSRASWVPLRDPSVPLVNLFGLQVPLGNCNFLGEEYRACEMNLDRRLDYCP
jgi:hypothetical protein